MGLDYDNSAFYYFAIFALLVYIVPSSWYIIKTCRKYQREVAQEGRTEEESKALQDRLERRVLLTRGYIVNLVCTVISIALFALLCYLVAGDSEIARYDPFQILGVEPGATDNEIKKAYRHLAREKHPDKNLDNPNAEEEFQVIAKAYEALTDPVAKENFEKYGNPDGKQTMELSIGLPAFLTEGKNQAVFVFLYIVGLVFVIPVVVYRRYKNNRKFGLKGNPISLNSSIYKNTWRLWFHYIKAYKPVDTLSALYSCAFEFMERDPPDKRMNAAIELWDKHMASVSAPFSKESKRVKKLQKRQKSEVTAEQEDPWRVFPGQYNTMLLFFHLNRATHLLTPDMRNDLIFMLAKVELFIQALVESSFMFERMGALNKNVLGVIELSQRITQAIWLDKDASVLIPGLPELIEAKKTKKAKNLSVPSLWSLLDRKRRNQKLIAGVDLSEEDEAHVMQYLNVLPFPDLKARAYVEGVEDESEKGIIRQGDVLTFEVALQYSQYIKKSVEEIEAEKRAESESKEEQKDEEDDGLEDDLIDPDQDASKKPEFINNTAHNLRVYAPNFPHDRKDQWWIVVIERQGATEKIAKAAKGGAVNRKKKKGVDKKAKKMEKLENADRVILCESFEMTEPYCRKVMQIRPSAKVGGERIFEIHVRSAAYFGLDPPPTSITMRVEKALVEEEEEADSSKKGSRKGKGQDEAAEDEEEEEEMGEYEEEDSDEEFNPDEY